MRERVTKIFSCLFITSSLLVALFPFFIVKADSTYVIASDGIFMYNTTHTNLYVKFADQTSEIRALAFKYNDKYRFCWVSANSFKYGKSESQLPATANKTPYHNEVTGEYYVAVEIEWNFLSTPYPIINWDTSWGDFEHPNYVDVEKAIYYTFGPGSSNSESSDTWGGPANVMYNTRISGTGQMASQNIDRIVFSPDIDSNGNILPDNARFQIRAVPLEYSGLTPTDVLSKTYSQAVLNYTDAAVLMDRIPANGVYEVKWSEVVETLSIPFATVSSVIQGDDYFYKMGWIYEIRLQIDDYYSDWIKIYTATSSGAQVEEDISNSDTMSQQLIENIAIVNNLNETTVNWYINETEINMTEYNEPSSGDKPWWAYLLEAIVNSFNITNNYINEGNDTTINISNTVKNSDDDMNNKINQYQQYEDDFIQDMDDNLTDIDTDVPLLSNSKFVNSAQWVAQQYTRMTNNTVIGSLLGFSLVFGLALIFIGRIR